MRNFLICMVFVFLLGCSNESNVHLQGTEVITLASKELDESRQLHIHLPKSYEDSTHNYPVLFMTDGRANLTHTLASIEFLVDQGMIPEVIIVGIESNHNRTRNLTPTFREDSLKVLPFDEAMLLTQSPGGAEQFLSFIANSVKPYVTQHYRAAEHHVFAGHSFGGLFAFYTLIERPDLFDAYIAISPSLWWDHELWVDKLSKLNTDIFQNKSIHLSVGNEGSLMVSPFEQAKEHLSNKTAEGYRFSAQYFVNENHSSVVYQGMYHGLRAVFSDFALTLDKAQLGEAPILAHQITIKEKYGVPQDLISNLEKLAYDAIFEGQPVLATALFEMIIAKQPDALSAYMGLASIYAKQQNYLKAIETYERALQMPALLLSSRSMINANIEQYKDKL